MGKRHEIRKKREEQARKKRNLIIFVVVGIAVIVSGFIIAESMKPIGEINVPDQRSHAETEGLAMGDPNAPIIVEEFSDFQCVACYRFWLNLEQEFVDKYVSTGQVYFKYSPFSFIGPESFSAAEAAYCANDQGRFWDYHDMLFENWNGENVGNFSDQRLIAFAEAINLDVNEFRSCYRGNTYRAQVQQDANYGTQQGVTATPTFSVNGQLVYSDTLFQTIDELLSNN